MFLKRLNLVNFRNFITREFIFPNDCIVFEGLNGIGKTNILESIYYLCTGKSQRKSKKKDLINFNKDFFL
jgi:DNA replication and repair protein RecF